MSTEQSYATSGHREQLTIEYDVHPLISDASRALDYAVRGGLRVPPDVIHQIVESTHEHYMSIDMEERLYASFNELCTLIRPASIESIKAMDRNVELRNRFRFYYIFTRFFRFFSEADIVARGYTALFIILIFVILPFQLHAWIGASLIKEGGSIAAVLEKSISEFKSARFSYKEELPQRVALLHKSGVDTK
jgi:hypothetical protein